MDVKFDQHFLKEEEFLDLIVESAEIGSEDVVFEIGPGEGDLSKKILKAGCLKLVACEKDRGLFSFLDRTAKDWNNFEFVFGNGLEIFESVKFDKLVANIPYAITEPLFGRILDSDLEFAVLLFGMDFYRNICERDSRWNLFVNAFFDVDLVCEVGGENFCPPTKVKSAVVRFVRKLDSDLSERDKFFQSLWKKRSRSLKNALVFSLVDCFGLSKKDALSRVSDLKGDLISEDIWSLKVDLVSNKNLFAVYEKLKELNLF